MAFLPRSPGLSQATVGDIGRCGQPYNYVPSMLSAEESAAQAGSRLLTAAASGDVAQAARCLADGADRDYQDPSSGETALHRAAQHGHVPVMELILTAGADANHTDYAQRTPLYVAANAGCLPAVRTLLDRSAELFPDRPLADACGSSSSQPLHPQSGQSRGPASTDNDDALFLSLRSTCPLAAASAAARWPIVAALLTRLPPHYQYLPSALRSLRFLVWALASHKAFPREVISRLPRRLPRCVVDAVRPAHLASTPLVLASGNDQQQLMQWLLQQGADPELGAPLLLCAGRFCHGSRTCCVNTLLRRGARPNVAWADSPGDSPLQLAAAGDCFTHVHCLVAYGADVDEEAARVRQVLYTPPEWEAHLDELKAAYDRDRAAAAAAVGGTGAGIGGVEEEAVWCPCGQQHARWPGLWPLEGEEGEQQQEGEVEKEEEGEGAAAAAVAAAEGAGGNSCFNQAPADDAWYRHHRQQMEQLQDGKELAECRRAVDELWRYGCSAVVSELAAGSGGSAVPPSVPPYGSPMPFRVLAAMQDVAGGWLAAAARCRQQRLLRLELYDKAVTAGRRLLERKRTAALAALSGTYGMQQTATAAAAAAAAAASLATRAAAAGVTSRSTEDEGPQAQEAVMCDRGLTTELRMEILVMAGLAPPGVEARRTLAAPTRGSCGCGGCSR
ncbi:hypothetical protein Agub_g13678 [Astrephomene gubernaculifera]|uniref:Uncharacterized protein n=1 Tax=Astrephomene gubernaculifera TaxID=47775 RepID=A0AAD3E0N1_9CHLO|nr:hypothetical protein Agub_g13678 [Astrephomene gubernaculifera]